MSFSCTFVVTVHVCICIAMGAENLSMLNVSCPF
jgi:hypothetical protein